MDGKKAPTTKPGDFSNDLIVRSEKIHAEAREGLRLAEESLRKSAEERNRDGEYLDRLYKDSEKKRRQFDKELEEGSIQRREFQAKVHKLSMSLLSVKEIELAEIIAAKAKRGKAPQESTETHQKKAGRKLDDKITNRNKEIAKVAPQARGRRHQPKPSEARARTVAKLIKELDVLEPQMYGESEYERLARENPSFLTFRVADSRGDLKEKVLYIQGHHRHIRLAQELAAAKHGKKPNTIRTDWKHHKPPEFRRKLS